MSETSIKEEIQGKNGGTSKSGGAEASKTLIERKHLTDLTKEIKQSNSKIASRWG